MKKTNFQYFFNQNFNQKKKAAKKENPRKRF